MDSVFFVCFSFWHIFGQLVVAIATLNVKYAGESVYLALSVILELCESLSWHNLYCTTTICLIMKYKPYSTCVCSVVVSMQVIVMKSAKLSGDS